MRLRLPAEARAKLRWRDEFAPKGVLVWLINSTPQNDPGPAKLDAMHALGRYAPKKMLGDRYAVNGDR